MNVNKNNQIFLMLDQVEVMVEMLINDGRANTNTNCFTLSHDDVLIALELIKGRVACISDEVSRKNSEFNN
jgi:hypothetical protein